MKEIERLKREMTRENEELGLSGEGRDEDDGLGYVVEVDGNAVPQPPPTLAEQIQGDDSGSETLDVLDEFVSEESPKNGEQLQVDQVEGLDMQPPEIVSASPELSKKEKRRLREARKVQVAQAERNTAQACNVCKKPFENRTKLFSHIRETGHALAHPDDNASQVKKSKKGKR